MSARFFRRETRPLSTCRHGQSSLTKGLLAPPGVRAKPPSPALALSLRVCTRIYTPAVLAIVLLARTAMLVSDVICTSCASQSWRYRLRVHTARTQQESTMKTAVVPYNSSTYHTRCITGTYLYLVCTTVRKYKEL